MSSFHAIAAVVFAEGFRLRLAEVYGEGFAMKYLPISQGIDNRIDSSI
jgi:hypothetical protein